MVYKLQLSLIEKYTVQGFCFLFFLVINVISLINKSNTIFIYLLMLLLLQSLNTSCSATPFSSHDG